MQQRQLQLRNRIRVPERPQITSLHPGSNSNSYRPKTFACRHRNGESRATSSSSTGLSGSDQVLVQSSFNTLEFWCEFFWFFDKVLFYGHEDSILELDQGTASGVGAIDRWTDRHLRGLMIFAGRGFPALLV